MDQRIHSAFTNRNVLICSQVAVFLLLQLQWHVLVCLLFHVADQVSRVSLHDVKHLKHRHARDVNIWKKSLSIHGLDTAARNKAIEGKKKCVKVTGNEAIDKVVRHVRTSDKQAVSLVKSLWRWRGEMFSTSFRRPEVKEGERTLRILFHWSSSAMDTASYNGPFRRKFWDKVRTGQQQLKPVTDSELCGERAYSAIGEEGVALLHQNSLYHGRIGDAQDRLAAVKNAGGEISARECEQKKELSWNHRHTQTKTYPQIFPYFLKHSSSKLKNPWGRQ